MIDPDDPRRCTAQVTGGNQCESIAQDGKYLCEKHQAQIYPLAIKSKRKESLYEFAEQEFRRRLSTKNLKSSKTTREEEGILKILLEDIINSKGYQGRTGELINLIRTINDLKKTNFQIEKETGQLMSRDDAIALGQQMLQILVEEVEKYQNQTGVTDLLEKVADRFTDTLC